MAQIVPLFLFSTAVIQCQPKQIKGERFTLAHNLNGYRLSWQVNEKKKKDMTAPRYYGIKSLLQIKGRI